VREDSLNRCLLFDARDYPQLSAALPAGLDVDSEHALKVLRPVQWNGERNFLLSGRAKKVRPL